jgi:2-C-methyl-D-erythritol 2,4-cyclodiphosphate synthase
MRVGTGWDIHPLVEGRSLLIGGVIIPHNLGEAGHSDGDVLLHAIIDAILGALALGDIGTHFPPHDDQWKDVQSASLLLMALDLLQGWEIVNIDSTIILQQPKLAPYILSIRKSLAELCELPLDCVSVKAKTAEHMLGEIGNGRAIIAQASVLMQHSLSDNETTLDQWV